MGVYMSSSATAKYKDRIRQDLIKLAKAGRSISYGDLAAPYNMDPHYELPAVLGLICEEDHLRNNQVPMISCLVGSMLDPKTKHYVPGQGFFKLAETLGKENVFDQDTFLKAERARTFNFWK